MRGRFHSATRRATAAAAALLAVMFGLAVRAQEPDPPVEPLAAEAETTPRGQKSSQLTALLFYATDEGEGMPVKKIADPGNDTERYQAALKKAAPAAHYVLIGKDTQELKSSYSIWLRPSLQFPLQIENTGIVGDGGLSLYWILWQKEPVDLRKDRELVKSNTVLTRDKPLVIAGPKWRAGRLLFVVRRD